MHSKCCCLAFVRTTSDIVYLCSKQTSMPAKEQQQEGERKPPASKSPSAAQAQSVVSSSTTRARQDALGGQVSSSSLWPSAGSLWVPAWQEPHVNLFSTLQIHRLAQIVERQERLQGGTGASTADDSSDKQTAASGTKSSKEDHDAETTTDKHTTSGSSSKMSQSMSSPEWAAKHVMRRKGNVNRIMDHAIGKLIFKVVGRVSTSNYIEIPRAVKGKKAASRKTPVTDITNLGLKGTFVYIQARGMARKAKPQSNQKTKKGFMNFLDGEERKASTMLPASFYIDVVTTSNYLYRLSFSSFHTEFGMRLEKIIEIPIELSTTWCTMAISIPSLLAAATGGKESMKTFRCVKSFKFSCNMSIRNVWTSNELYDGRDIPKDMALPLPDNTDYFDMFEWYFAPVCPTRKDDKAKKKSSRRKGPKQLPGLKLSPEQHQYAVEELEEVLGARKDLGVRFAKKSKKQKEDKKAKEKETDEEEEEEDSSEDESLTSESMQEIESDRESDLGNLEEEIEELQKQEHVDSSADHTQAERKEQAQTTTKKSGEELKQELTGISDRLTKAKVSSLANIDNSLCTYPVTEGTKLLDDMSMLGCTGSLQNSIRWTESGKELLYAGGPTLVSLSVSSYFESAEDGESGSKGRYMFASSNSTSIEGRGEIDGCRLQNGDESTNGKYKSLPQKHFTGHAGPVVGFRLSPREEFLVTVCPFSHYQGYCTRVPELRIWDYKSCRLMAVLRGFLNREDRLEAKLFPWRSAGEWQPLEPERDQGETRPAKVGEQCLDVTRDGNCVVVNGTDWRGRTVITLLDVSEFCKKYFKDRTTNINRSAIRISARQMSDFPISTMKCMPGMGGEIVSAGKENVKIWRRKEEHFSGAPVVLSQYARGCEFTSIAFEPPALRSVSDDSFYSKRQVSGIDSASGSKRIFVASSQGCILQINYNTRALEAVFQLHTGPIHGIDVNEGFFVSCGADGFLRMWPHDFGTFFLEAHHDCPVTSASISPDGLKIASVTLLGSVGILDISSQSYSTLLRPHANTVHSIATRDAASGVADLVTASYDGSIRAWNTESWSPLTEFTLRDNDNQCTALAFFPSSIKFSEMSDAVVAGFESGKIRVLDVTTASVMYEFHQHQVAVSKIHFINEDSGQEGKEDKDALQDAQRLLIVSIAKDFSLCVYDIGRKFTPIRMLDLSGLFAMSAVGGLGGYKASVSFSNRLGKCVVSCYVNEEEGTVENCEGVDFSPVLLDSVEFSISGKLELQNTSVGPASRRTTQQCSHQTAAMSALSHGDRSNGSSPSKVKDGVHRYPTMATRVAFGPKTDVVYGGMNDGRIFKWDVHTGKLLQSIQNLGLAPSRRLHDMALPPFAITTLEPSSDGKLLLTAAKDGAISVWNAALMGPTPKDALCQRFEPCVGRFGPASWCAGGNYVVAAPDVLQCGMESKALRLFDVAAEQGVLSAAAKGWRRNRNVGGLFASGAVLRWRVNNGQELWSEKEERPAECSQPAPADTPVTSSFVTSQRTFTEYREARTTPLKEAQNQSFDSLGTDIAPIAEREVDTEGSELYEPVEEEWHHDNGYQPGDTSEPPENVGKCDVDSVGRPSESRPIPPPSPIRQEAAHERSSSSFQEPDRFRQKADALQVASSLLEYRNMGFDTSGKVPAVFLAHANEVALPKRSQVLVQPLDSLQQTVIQLSEAHENAVEITALASDDIGFWLAVGLRHHSKRGSTGEIQLWCAEDMDDTGSVHQWKCCYALVCRHTVPVVCTVDSQFSSVAALVEAGSDDVSGGKSFSVSVWNIEGMKTGGQSDSCSLIDKPDTSSLIAENCSSPAKKPPEFIFKWDARIGAVGLALINMEPYVILPRGRNRFGCKKLASLSTQEDTHRFQRVSHADLRITQNGGEEGVLLALAKSNQSCFLGWLSWSPNDFNTLTWKVVAELLVAKAPKKINRVASLNLLENSIVCVFRGGNVNVWDYSLSPENVAAATKGKGASRKARAPQSQPKQQGKSVPRKHLNLDSNVPLQKGVVQKHSTQPFGDLSGATLPMVNVQNSVSLVPSQRQVRVKGHPNSVLMRCCDGYDTQLLFVSELGSLWRLQCTFVDPTRFGATEETCYWEEAVLPQPLEVLGVQFSDASSSLVSLSFLRRDTLLLMTHSCVKDEAFSRFPDLQAITGSTILECADVRCNSRVYMDLSGGVDDGQEVLCVSVQSKLMIFTVSTLTLIDEFVFAEDCGLISSLCVYPLKTAHVALVGMDRGDVYAVVYDNTGVKSWWEFSALIDPQCHAFSRHGSNTILQIRSYSSGNSTCVAIASGNGFLSIWDVSPTRKASNTSQQPMKMRLLDTMALSADLRDSAENTPLQERVDIAFNSADTMSMICTRRTSDEEPAYFLVSYSLEDKRITNVSDPLPFTPVRLVAATSDERRQWTGISFHRSDDEGSQVAWLRSGSSSNFGLVKFVTPAFSVGTQLRAECPLGVFPSIAAASSEGLTIFSHSPSDGNDSLNYSNCET
eukprot:gb/GECG01001759.1/.p1 GENE.gb/GECG01001759.1/~~gb/GECG01001759.1/.p1  ORF type:complete len:2484 (+),score=303.27 gb/GECG01001759.1/:1-7452(+)